jgi:hypothetical protein
VLSDVGLAAIELSVKDRTGTKARDGNVANSHAKEACAATEGGRAMEARGDIKRLKKLIVKSKSSRTRECFRSSSKNSIAS